MPKPNPVPRTAKKIADALGETDPTPVNTIQRLVEVAGDERALALLAEALKVEAEGGLMTDNKARRRTVGGVFFKLAKGQLSTQERWRVFTPKKQESKKSIEPPKWSELEPLIAELAGSPKGEAVTVKITIVGKPERVIEKENVVLTSLHSTNAPSLPKGLPKPPTQPTTYLIFIAKKQWSKIKDSLNENPNDKLIVEGYPVFDSRIGQTGAMSIYAQNVSTKRIQQAKRAQSNAKSDE